MSSLKDLCYKSNSNSEHSVFGVFGSNAWNNSAGRISGRNKDPNLISDIEGFLIFHTEWWLFL